MIPRAECQVRFTFGVYTMKNMRLILVGIDWADAEHAFHLIHPDGSAICGSFDQDPQVIDELLKTWRKRFPRSTFAISIESSKGPLVSALLKYDDVIIYPVNPAALANYRKAFAHGGGKNDPTDAELLAQYLEH